MDDPLPKLTMTEKDFRDLLIIKLQMMITWNNVLQEFHLKTKDIFIRQLKSVQS